MAKKTSTESSTPVAEVNEQKKRKQQARQEAKMMLEVEEAKASIQKAEKKLAKAQAELEARNTHLRTLEADLTELRTSHKETEVSVQHSESDQQIAPPMSEDEETMILPDAGFDHQNGQPELEEVTSSNQ